MAKKNLELSPKKMKEYEAVKNLWDESSEKLKGLIMMQANETTPPKEISKAIRQWVKSIKVASKAGVKFAKDNK